MVTEETSKSNGIHHFVGIDKDSIKEYLNTQNGLFRQLMETTILPKYYPLNLKISIMTNKKILYSQVRKIVIRFLYPLSGMLKKEILNLIDQKNDKTIILGFRVSMRLAFMKPYFCSIISY